MKRSNSYRIQHRNTSFFFLNGIVRHQQDSEEHWGCRALGGSWAGWAWTSAVSHQQQLLLKARLQQKFCPYVHHNCSIFHHLGWKKMADLSIRSWQLKTLIKDFCCWSGSDETRQLCWFQSGSACVSTFSPVRAFRVEVSLPDRTLPQNLIYALQAGPDQAKQRQVNLPAGVRGHMNRLQPCGFPLVLPLSTKLSTGASPEPVDR